MSFFNLTALVVFLFLSPKLLAESAVPAGEPIDWAINKSYELYGKRRYEDALQILDSVKGLRDQNVKWYYFEGLYLARLERTDEALENFDNYIKKVEVGSAAKAYYFTGLLYFNKGQYQKALNSFQAAQDLSNDSSLDKLIDVQIEKTIKYRDYYDGHKAGNLSFLLGYEFHTNAVGVSQVLTDENLNGHVFNYGASLSYRPIDKVNFVFEPALTIVDRYTLNKEFKSTVTIQEVDALQVLFSAPITFYFGNTNGMQYNLSLNAYNTYIPITSSSRDLYINSTFFKGQVLSDLTSQLSLDFSIVAATDKSQNFATTEANATGSRGEASIGLREYTNHDKTKSFLASISIVKKDAEGIDARYQKLDAGISFQFPSFGETKSTLSLDYGTLSYPDKLTPRKDTFTEVDYAIVQSLSEQSSLNYEIGGIQNSSDADFFKYDDYKIGIQYSVNFGF